MLEGATSLADQSRGIVLTNLIFGQLHASWILLQPVQNFRVLLINHAACVSLVNLYFCTQIQLFVLEVFFYSLLMA